jgi:hypothetical protein
LQPIAIEPDVVDLALAGKDLLDRRGDISTSRSAARQGKPEPGCGQFNAPRSGLGGKLTDLREVASPHAEHGGIFGQPAFHGGDELVGKRNLTVGPRLNNRAGISFHTRYCQDDAPKAGGHLHQVLHATHLRLFAVERPPFGGLATARKITSFWT